jgi:DNA-binding CsgD family transcriptional regulator
MSAADDRRQRIAMLQRLTGSEFQLLRHRCAGQTTGDIAAQLGLTAESVRTLLADVYDKLGVTWESQATSLDAVERFCPLLADPEVVPLAASAAPDDLTRPLPTRPSERALQLVDDDDAALLAGRAAAPTYPRSQARPQPYAAPAPYPPMRAVRPAGRDSRQSALIVFGIIAVVLVTVLVVLLYRAASDDDDGNAGADATAQAADATSAALTAEAGANIPPTETPGEAPTSTPESTATTEPATSTPEPPTPTATLEATATEAPTDTPEPTATQEATATVEPTAAATATLPPPLPGTLAYEADWSDGAGDWVLADGWSIEDGTLVGDGSTGGDNQPAPFDPTSPDYAIEADITIVAGDNGCPDGAGVFGRLVEESTAGIGFDAGYFGLVCADRWEIAATRELTALKQVLEVGDFEPAATEHTYRLELAGETLRLFIDGVFTGETTNDRWTEPGLSGLYVSGDYQIVVTGFRVYALEP